jgi:hypothetical protein
VRNCEDYVLHTANKKHIKNLVQLQVRTQLTLDQALQQQAKGEEDLSENWIAEAEATLSGVQRILEAASAESETALRPFKGKGSTSKPWNKTVPRPTLVEKAREAVRSYLLTAEMLSPEKAPLNTLSVAHALGFNRKTLKKYGLDVEIARASERQARNGNISPHDSERRSYADKLHQRDSEIEASAARLWFRRSAWQRETPSA